MDQHLHIITLGVRDFERSKSFYAETLGWRISRPQEGIAFFQAGGVVLALFPREELAKDALVNVDGDNVAGFTLAYNAKSESEVDEIIDGTCRMSDREYGVPAHVTSRLLGLRAAFERAPPVTAHTTSRTRRCRPTAAVR